MSSEQQANRSWVPSAVEPLNETLWQAWLARGRARDNRRRAELNTTVRYASVAVLLVTAGVWSNLAGYDVLIRFAVATGALFTAVQAFRHANYAIVGVFGIIALLYNPVVPAVLFAGEWQRAFVLVSAVLFMTSAYWPTRQVPHA
jgi:Family of unknown function (DUF6804)